MEIPVCALDLDLGTKTRIYIIDIQGVGMVKRALYEVDIKQLKHGITVYIKSEIIGEFLNQHRRLDDAGYYILESNDTDLGALKFNPESKLWYAGFDTPNMAIFFDKRIRDGYSIYDDKIHTYEDCKLWLNQVNNILLDYYHTVVIQECAKIQVQGGLY